MTTKRSLQKYLGRLREDARQARARAYERVKAVKWLPPIAINARGSSEDMPAVVRTVR